MNKNAIAELVVAWPAINSFDIVKVIVISVKVSTLFSFSAFDINVWPNWYQISLREMLLISQISVNVCCCIFTLQLDVYYERFVFKKYFLSLICAKYNFYYFCFCIIQISGHFDLGFFSCKMSAPLIFRSGWILMLWLVDFKHRSRVKWPSINCTSAPPYSGTGYI